MALGYEHNWQNDNIIFICNYLWNAANDRKKEITFQKSFIHVVIYGKWQNNLLNQQITVIVIINNVTTIPV